MTTCMILKNEEVIYVSRNINEAVHAIESMCIDECIKKRGFDYVKNIMKDGGIYDETSLNNLPRGFYTIKLSPHKYQVVYKNKNGWVSYGSIVRGEEFKLYIGRVNRTINRQEFEINTPYETHLVEIRKEVMDSITSLSTSLSLPLSSDKGKNN